MISPKSRSSTPPSLRDLKPSSPKPLISSSSQVGANGSSFQKPSGPRPLQTSSIESLGVLAATGFADLPTVPEGPPPSSASVSAVGVQSKPEGPKPPSSGGEQPPSAIELKQLLDEALRREGEANAARERALAAEVSVRAELAARAENSSTSGSGSGSGGDSTPPARIAVSKSEKPLGRPPSPIRASGEVSSGGALGGKPEGPKPYKDPPPSPKPEGRPPSPFSVSSLSDPLVPPSDPPPFSSSLTTLSFEKGSGKTGQPILLPPPSSDIYSGAIEGGSQRRAPPAIPSTPQPLQMLDHERDGFRPGAPPSGLRPQTNEGALPFSSSASTLRERAQLATSRQVHRGISSPQFLSSSAASTTASTASMAGKQSYTRALHTASAESRESVARTMLLLLARDADSASLATEAAQGKISSFASTIALTDWETSLVGLQDVAGELSSLGAPLLQARGSEDALTLEMCAPKLGSSGGFEPTFFSARGGLTPVSSLAGGTSLSPPSASQVISCAASLGFPVARVMHWLCRTYVLAARQDLAHVRTQLSVALREVAAIEYDVCGSRGSHFGSRDKVDRAPICEDMPRSTLVDYSRSAAELREGVALTSGADGHVGTPVLKEHLERSGALLRKEAMGVIENEVKVLAMDRESLVKEGKELEEKLAACRSGGETVIAKKEEMAGKLRELRCASEESRSRQEDDLHSVAVALASCEGLKLSLGPRPVSRSPSSFSSSYSDEVTIEELISRPLDESPEAVERRFRVLIESTQAETRAAVSAEWEGRVFALHKSTDDTLAGLKVSLNDTLSSMTLETERDCEELQQMQQKRVPTSHSSHSSLPSTIEALIALKGEGENGQLLSPRLLAIAATASQAQVFAAIEESKRAEGAAIKERLTAVEKECALAHSAGAAARAVYDLKVAVRRIWAYRGVKAAPANAFLMDAFRAAPYSSILALRLREAFRSLRAGVQPPCTPLEVQVWAEGLVASAGVLGPAILSRVEGILPEAPSSSLSFSPSKVDLLPPASLAPTSRQLLEGPLAVSSSSSFSEVTPDHRESLYASLPGLRDAARAAVSNPLRGPQAAVAGLEVPLSSRAKVSAKYDPTRHRELFVQAFEGAPTEVKGSRPQPSPSHQPPLRARSPTRKVAGIDVLDELEFAALQRKRTSVSSEWRMGSGALLTFSRDEIKRTETRGLNSPMENKDNSTEVVSTALQQLQQQSQFVPKFSASSQPIRSRALASSYRPVPLTTKGAFAPTLTLFEKEERQQSIAQSLLETSMPSHLLPVSLPETEDTSPTLSRTIKDPATMKDHFGVPTKFASTRMAGVDTPVDVPLIVSSGVHLLKGHKGEGHVSPVDRKLPPASPYLDLTYGLSSGKKFGGESSVSAIPALSDVNARYGFFMPIESGITSASSQSVLNSFLSTPLGGSNHDEPLLTRTARTAGVALMPTPAASSFLRHPPPK